MSDPDVRATRAAAVLYIVLGAGFAVGSALTVLHLDRHGELPMTPFGFRSMGGGPFDQLGTEVGAERFTMLGWALVVTSALDVVAGIWLWQGRRRGARLGLATSPVTLALGVGFALPFLLLAAPIRAALVLVGRRSLR